MTEQYKNLLLSYGQEYLLDKDPDSAPMEMEQIDEYYSNKALDAITRAFFGYRYNPYRDDHDESFNPNDEYFAFNGYGNFISIQEYDLASYLNGVIDEKYFMQWCSNEGYID